MSLQGKKVSTVSCGGGFVISLGPTIGNIEKNQKFLEAASLKNNRTTTPDDTVRERSIINYEHILNSDKINDKNHVNSKRNKSFVEERSNERGRQKKFNDYIINRQDEEVQQLNSACNHQNNEIGLIEEQIHTYQDKSNFSAPRLNYPYRNEADIKSAKSKDSSNINTRALVDNISNIEKTQNLDNLERNDLIYATFSENEKFHSFSNEKRMLKPEINHVNEKNFKDNAREELSEPRLMESHKNEDTISIPNRMKREEYNERIYKYQRINSDNHNINRERDTKVINKYNNDIRYQEKNGKSVDENIKKKLAKIFDRSIDRLTDQKQKVLEKSIDRMLHDDIDNYLDTSTGKDKKNSIEKIYEKLNEKNNDKIAQSQIALNGVQIFRKQDKSTERYTYHRVDPNNSYHKNNAALIEADINNVNNLNKYSIDDINGSRTNNEYINKKSNDFVIKKALSSEYTYYNEKFNEKGNIYEEIKEKNKGHEIPEGLENSLSEVNFQVTRRQGHFKENKSLKDVPHDLKKIKNEHEILIQNKIHQEQIDKKDQEHRYTINEMEKVIILMKIVKLINYLNRN